MSENVFSNEFAARLRSALEETLTKSPITLPQLTESLGLEGDTNKELVRLAVKVLHPEVLSMKRWGFYLKSTPRPRKGSQFTTEEINGILSAMKAQNADQEPVAIARLASYMGMDVIKGSRKIRTAFKTGKLPGVSIVKGPNGGLRLNAEASEGEERAA